MIRYAVPLSLIAALALAGAAGGTASKPRDGRENILPVWSPDGTRIAFMSTGRGVNEHDIWVMRSDGTGLRNLTPDEMHEGLPAWSPDGERLAFSSESASSGWAPSVEVIDADGGGRRLLGRGNVPAWSPDGRRIAYTGEGGIHVLELAGGDRLVGPAATGEAGRPRWSPDGARIAYVRERDVWVVDVDGSRPQRLTSIPAPRIAFIPAWSPDGSTIAFVVVGPFSAPEPNEVWTVGADGTALRLVMTAGFVDGPAAWAPDGRSFVFAAAKSRDGEVELYRAAAPDGQPVNLSNDRAWNQTPVFDPDGDSLAFGIRHGGGYRLSDIWTLDLDTGRRRNLTGTASGERIDARSVRPPNRLTLARVVAWLERPFQQRPILRVEARVSNRTRDEVSGAVVSFTHRLPDLVPLSRTAPVTDGHGYAQQAWRLMRPGGVRVGSRIRVTVSARPRGPHAQRVSVSRVLQLRVAARWPPG